MMRKHLIFKKRSKKMFTMELIMPIYMGGIIYFILSAYESMPVDISSVLAQFFMVFYTPYITMMSTRFIVTSMVEDKETKMRETLRLMSLSRFNYCLSFFVYQAILSFWNGCIIGGIMFTNKNAFVVEDTRLMNSISYILIAIVLSLGMIGYAMALSTLFSDTKVGQNMSQMAIFLPLILFLAVSNQNGSVKYLTYFTFLTPIGAASAIIGILTNNPVVPVPLINIDFLNIYYCWIAAILNIPLWLGIYIYLEQVMPNTYGIQRSPCFCCSKKKRQTDYFYDIENPDQFFDANDPIKLEKLSKKFGDFTAVNQLNLSIREGEIFTILGHNGAGKTTAIYMLTGVLQPSGGDAYMYGNSIKDELEKVQKNLGLCQQFDVLFELLNCEEHLRLVCELKAMDP
jgi:ATP-binding cassette subfamily A (ABC1) protein 3